MLSAFVVFAVLITFAALAGCSIDLGSLIGGDAEAHVGQDGGSGGQDGGSDAANATGLGGSLRFNERTPYGDDTYVVVNTAIDIYELPDIASTRVTQLLFGQPVQVLEVAGAWARVSVGDRSEGWTRLRNIDSDWACVDHRRYSARIVVASREKQIMSSPRNGIVVRDVGMGTELFVIRKSESLYEVALPGNLAGWILENGTFQLGIGERAKMTTAATFAQTVEKFRGASYLQGGVSFQGIDGAGLLQVCAKINGVELPFDLAGQFWLGEPIDPAVAHAVARADDIDAEGLPAAALEIGDVLFFYGTPSALASDGAAYAAENQDLADAGVYTGEGRFIHASQHAGKVQYELVSDAYYVQRLAGIRRYFPDE